METDKTAAVREHSNNKNHSPIEQKPVRIDKEEEENETLNRRRKSILKKNESRRIDESNGEGAKETTELTKEERNEINAKTLQDNEEYWSKVVHDRTTNSSTATKRVQFEEKNGKSMNDELRIGEDARTYRSKLLIFRGKTYGIPCKVLIDSGASRNFIDVAFVERHKLATRDYKTNSTIVLADGTSRKMRSYINNLKINIGEYQDRVNVNVFKLGNYDIILGKSWLSRINPEIDWEHNTVTIKTNEGKEIRLTLDGEPADDDVENFLLLYE